MSDRGKVTKRQESEEFKRDSKKYLLGTFLKNFSNRNSTAFNIVVPLVVFFVIGAPLIYGLLLLVTAAVAALAGASVAAAVTAMLPVGIFVAIGAGVAALVGLIVWGGYKAGLWLQKPPGGGKPTEIQVDDEKVNRANRTEDSQSLLPTRMPVLLKKEKKDDDESELNNDNSPTTPNKGGDGKAGE